MIRVIETFSGIGAQAKALNRLNIDYEIVATAEWDINAIIAYDLIHNGEQNIISISKLSKQEIIDKLSRYTFSPDGKIPYTKESMNRLNINLLRSLLCAIKRTNNLASITDMTSKDVPEDLDLFTYSFPCQDLSIAGVWHGNLSGINRDVINRSGMLWEVERILKECVKDNKKLPQFLLMENVSNILAKRHMSNFQEWIDYLRNIGYHNKIYKLNSSKFGVPQTRERVFMLSVFTGGSLEKEKKLLKYFSVKDLQNDTYLKSLPLKRINIKNIIRNDYDKEKYKNEADKSQLNDTPSRRKIVEENDKIYENGKYKSVLKTITTKQDRNPNSGVIEYKFNKLGKLNYRYLTPRECFLAMGFDESDYEVIIQNNFNVAKNRELFSDGKLIKMAGNSIVVNVLEAVFIQIIEIKTMLENASENINELKNEANYVQCLINEKDII